MQSIATHTQIGFGHLFFPFSFDAPTQHEKPQFLSCCCHLVFQQWSCAPWPMCTTGVVNAILKSSVQVCCAHLSLHQSLSVSLVGFCVCSVSPKPHHWPVMAGSLQFQNLQMINLAMLCVCVVFRENLAQCDRRCVIFTSNIAIVCWQCVLCTKLMSDSIVPLLFNCVSEQSSEFFFSVLFHFVWVSTTWIVGWITHSPTGFIDDTKKWPAERSGCTLTQSDTTH